MRRHRDESYGKHCNGDAEKRRLRSMMQQAIYRDIPPYLRRKVQAFLSLPRARIRCGMLIDILLGLAAFRRKALGYGPIEGHPDASDAILERRFSRK